MAYLIGNTTVISNNGALGAVDGNSLNIANNNNISAGASVNYNDYNSSSNFAVSNLGQGMVGVILAGGGGGAYRPNANSPGGQGGLAMDNIDLGAGGNITVTVGGGGSDVGNGTAPAGGPSSFAVPLSPRSPARTSTAGNGGISNPSNARRPGNPGSGITQGGMIPGKGGSAQPGYAFILGIG